MDYFLHVSVVVVVAALSLASWCEAQLALQCTVAPWIKDKPVWAGIPFRMLHELQFRRHLLSGLPH